MLGIIPCDKIAPGRLRELLETEGSPYSRLVTIYCDDMVVANPQLRQEGLS